MVQLASRSERTVTATTWELTIKPSFLSELLTLPGRMAR